VTDRKDSFLDEDGRPRPAASYESNYGAGAVDGGYTDRTDTDTPDFDPLRDRDYLQWRAAFEHWRAAHRQAEKGEA
jgi:hypothetical protein